ncbi:MAG: hypothetical protein GY749_16690 [Desulfobacteraceae bacterium]|nr:hypothetical protein [Desulfobacteraceae bacterium]
MYLICNKKKYSWNNLLVSWKKETGCVHELGDGDLPGKFRLGDIRAERYTCIPTRSMGTRTNFSFSRFPASRKY